MPHRTWWSDVDQETDSCCTDVSWIICLLSWFRRASHQIWCCCSPVTYPSNHRKVLANVLRVNKLLCFIKKIIWIQMFNMIWNQLQYFNPFLLNEKKIVSCGNSNFASHACFKILSRSNASSAFFHMCVLFSKGWQRGSRSWKRSCTTSRRGSRKRKRGPTSSPATRRSCKLTFRYWSKRSSIKVFVEPVADNWYFGVLLT